MNTLEINNLQKTYAGGVQALADISLTLTDGMFGLLGPNGAGKSSFMRTIAQLQQADSGSIKFNGVDVVRDPDSMRRKLGYLPQEFGVYPKMSALLLLDHLAILKGVRDKRARREQIDSLLDQTNLTAHRHRAVHTFSGGMRQRFGIAQALLGDPKLIIVDEPTAGLDPEERNRFNNLLSEIGEQLIVILSTHIVEDVEGLCPQMGILVNGKIIRKGSPLELIDALKGQIWAKTVKKQELPALKAIPGVISSRLNAGNLTIHVQSLTQPGADFQLVAPDLEDVYFSTLHTQGHV
jgi:ABC-2 type transport system ATP-binding protein